MTTQTMTPSDDGVDVRLHKAAYMAQGIRDAMKVFAEFATFTLRRDGDHYHVEIRGIDPDLDGDLVGEFCNFALVHTVERKRRTPGAAEARA